MSDQLWLPGFDDPVAKYPNIYFALRPDAQFATHIARAAVRDRDLFSLQGKLIEAPRLHISLLGIHDPRMRPDKMIAGLRAIGESVREAPFEIHFDRIVSFRGGKQKPRVLVSDDGGAAIKSFQRAIIGVLADAGVSLSVRREFTPHMTLMYATTAISEVPIEPIRWMATRFALIESVIGDRRHNVRGEWALRA
ncbi:2'-5' RNA ligase family protein [Terrarubrum flagellatum]|uniref:2'-5' RNA ligase family protein n=1 Tax=Terrirubrum flagellatum TaxID=2895980 RepID=UPI003144EED6